jgi:uncharacterized protein (TIGR03663 family)
MQKTTMSKTSWLERPALSAWRLDWEKATYVVLILLAIFTRFYGLGWRAMSHDESLHVVYAYKLYNGEGYQHDPMMHGPFKFHITALSYFLFGANDFTSRLWPALFGVILVGLPFFMRRWLGRLGALAASLMFLISPYLTYYARYIRDEPFMVVLSLVMVILILRYLESQQSRHLVAIAAVLSVMFCTMEVAYIFVLMVGVCLVAGVLVEMLRRGSFSLERTPLFDLTMLIGTLSLPLATAFPIRLFGGNPLDYSAAGIARTALVFAAFLIVTVAIGLWWNRRLWPVAAGAYYTIFVLLYTTFFTNGKGFATGIVGSLGYWLEQQGVRRGSQPWYYYGIVTPLYEFLPLLLGLAAIVVFLSTRPPAEERRRPGAAVAINDLGFFMPFVSAWIVLSILAFTVAGEKMPWLSVYIAEPAIVGAAWLVNRVLGAVDWREAWKKGAALFAGGLIVLVFAIAGLLSIRPFAGREVEQLSATMGWLAALLLGAGMVALVVWYAQKLGRRLSLQTAFAALFVFLAILTTRTMWMANFINYDYATEFLVYAHATPDIKLVVNDLETLSRRLYGDRSIKFAYDDDSTWPFEWYFRQFPKATYYGAQPSKEALDAPVVIAGSKNWDKVKPFLGNRYYRFQYRLIWWPLEDYKDLTLQKAIAQLSSPAERKKLWNVWFYRRYEQSTAQWPLQHEFAVYVRKDIANQVWDFGARPAEAVETPTDIYLEGLRDWPSVATFGAQGKNPGQFTDPRNVAVGPDGRVYVVDTGNDRIQMFDANGRFIKTWGSTGNGPAQFKEPWGITVDAKGIVYVLDTWNHRVQKFSAEGEYQGGWGAYGSTGGTLGDQSVLWGPRGIVTDAQGNVYLTDTGNKRVQKFSPDGKPLGQWGGAGVEPGKFDEPVGIAMDKAGNFYVADTWNQRIQKFDSAFAFVKEWPILTWQGQSVLNKPYLAVGSDNRLYISDPEGFRILVYDLEGKFIAAFGTFGSDGKSFNLPTGLAASSDGYIYVADAGNHRVMKFKTLP